MRESAKSHNYVAMADSVVERVLVAQRGEQSNGTILIGKRFTVFERKVEKRPLKRSDCLIVPKFQRPTRHIQCFWVEGERARRPAMDVSRKLIQENYQRQRPVRLGNQAVMRAGGRGLEIAGEPAPYVGIERRVRFEPEFPRFSVPGRSGSTEPKIKHSTC